MCSISDNQIACGCWNGSIRILDDSTKVKTFKAHDTWIPYLLLVDDKKKLISCSFDKTIKIWNLKTFECVKLLVGHSDIVYNLELASNLNLLSCSEDKTVKFWQIETGELLKSIQFDSPVKYLKKVRQDLIAIALNNGEIHIYDISNHVKVKSISAHSTYVNQLYLLSNGCLLSGSENGEIKLWKI